MRVVDAVIVGARAARDTPVRLALEPLSALNLVARVTVDAAGLAVEAAEPVDVAAEGRRARVAERARARVRVAGREVDAVLYVAPWPLPEGADALLGAPTLLRSGLAP